MTSDNSSTANPIILFDGICNLCNGFVQFIIKRDKKAMFMFGALQSEKVSELLSSQNISVAKMESVILIEEGKIFQKSDAGLKIISRLPHWGWTKIFFIVPKIIRDFFYELIAKYRYKIFGKKESCMIPTPELRARFLK